MTEMLKICMLNSSVIEYLFLCVISFLHVVICYISQAFLHRVHAHPFPRTQNYLVAYVP
jgi:hypothetical protein